MDERAPDPGGAAREEMARQGIMVIGMAVAVVVAALVERRATDPDFLPALKMRAAKQAERFCAQSAAGWWRLAERARLAYEAERP